MNVLYFADIQAELAAFRSRQLDATQSGALPKASIESITKSDPLAKVIYLARAGNSTIRFNMKEKLFQDVRVRQAIHLAIDRHQFVDLITERQGVISGPVTPIFEEMSNTMDWLVAQPGYRTDKRQDLEEAKRLLKEAGYGDSLTFTALFTNDQGQGDIAAVMSDQLKAINVTMKVEQVDSQGQYLQRLINGEFQLTWRGFAYNVDADSVLSAHLHSGGGRNYGKFSDPKLDDLVEKQRRELNVEARRKIVHELESYILEQAPVLYAYATSSATLIQPWLHNWVDGPVTGDVMASVERAWMDKH